MTLGLAFIALLAAVNAPRVRLVLMQERQSERVIVGGLGAAAALAGVVVASAAAEPLRDAFGVSVETTRIGVGLVAVLVGARDLVTALPRPDPALPGRRAALVPVAFPLLLNPAVVFLAFGASLDHAVSTAVLVAIPALVTLPLLTIVEVDEDPGVGTGQRALAGAARLTAALLVLAGVAIAVDGVLDI